MRKLLAATLALCLACDGAWAAITFVADDGETGSATTSVVLPKPTGTAQNDLMVMCTCVQTTVSGGTISTPSGWTFVLSTGTVNDGAGNFNNTYMFFKVAGASEPANYTVSYNTGGTFTGIDGHIRTYRGTDTSANPINSSASVVTTPAATTAVVPALSETFVSGEWYVACANSDDNVIPTAIAPTLSHVFSTTGGDVSYYVGDLIPSVSPTAETFTYTGALAGRTAWGASIKPLGGAAASVPLRTLLGVGN